jgi:hypothetical protein
MKDNLARSFYTWFLTNLFGSLLLIIIMQMFDSEEVDVFSIICLIGAAVSLPSIFVSAACIRALKNLPPNTGIRLRFMLKATVGVVLCVLITIDLVFNGMLSMFLAVLLILAPHIIMALASSIYVNRDLIFIRPEELPIQPYENTEL